MSGKWQVASATDMAVKSGSDFEISDSICIAANADSQPDCPICRIWYARA